MFGLTSEKIDEIEKEEQSLSLKEAPVDEQDPKEAPLEHVEKDNDIEMSSVGDWAYDIAISFLNLMDIPDVNERRKALLDLEMGKKEDDIVTLFKISDSYLFLVKKFYDANSLDTDEAEFNSYIAKSEALKSWLGI